MFAEVVVNVPQVGSSFHYSIPPDLCDGLAVGHLVIVPFGKQRVQGIVVSFVEAPEVEEVKPILGRIDPLPVLTSPQIDLAYWLSHHYVAPLADCLTLMLPPGLAKRADSLYTLARPGATLDHPGQSRLVRLLEMRGPMRGRQLNHAFPRLNWRATADALVRQGVLKKQAVLDPPSVKPKHVRTARLAVAPAEAHAAKPRLGKPGSARAARLAEILNFLIMEGEPADVSWIYAETGANLPDLKRLAEEGLIDLGEAEVWRDPLAEAEFVPFDPPQLTPAQATALGTIRKGIEGSGDSGKSSVCLLHGVTGAGKTEIYLRALADMLDRKRRAIVLVPEIALTPQTVRRFVARFPGRVGVVHSQLTEGERYDTWRRARLGLIDVVIGPRSALFAPLPDIGLIVVDEEHDEAYKQDTSPCYHARDAAVEYARRLKAVCVLGSATPDLSSYHRARQGEWTMLQLPQRIMGHGKRLDGQASRSGVESRYRLGPGESRTIELPRVDVVDMRQELRAGNRSMFSRALRLALEGALSRGEQAILFLNRRGQASYVFCRDCGHALHCARCEMPFTYHGQDEQLICHHCNARRRHPRNCPRCDSDRIRHFGAGTEKVEVEVERAFPEARTLRWDADATRFKGAHEAILSGFVAGEANVLVGTQMIAKGLDLPLVTLVGVVSADVGLGLPDFRAAERTFQVLTQVAGRAGRGLLGGRVILQTFNPDHYAIQAASRHDYAEFFQKEMRYRRELGYPPYRQLVRLVYAHPHAERAERESVILAKQLRFRIERDDRGSTEIIGPAPCFFGRAGGEHRWQIVMRGPNPSDLVRGPGMLPRGWRVDVDPVSTL